MNIHDRVIHFIRLSSAQVFSTMLGVEIGEGNIQTEASPPQANDGVVSFIGVAGGGWTGTGSLACSATLACKVCSTMLMTESTAVDEDVLDAMAELTNMIVGNIKTELEHELGPLGLSIPTVVFGRNFKAKTAGSAEWSVVEFQWEGEPFIVRVCMAKAEPAHAFPHYGHTCAVDV